MDNIKLALCFKALSDETRIIILKMLKESGILCACKILENLSITQPTLSYHMKILADNDFIKVEKRGLWSHYTLNPQILSLLINALKELKEE